MTIITANPQEIALTKEKPEDQPADPPVNTCSI
uniref:Uncharacterized protein n=1 Tax=Rhizophora mucronata TaxID=61149 RepID=A0A2P2N8K4_RHIMU